MHWLGLFIVFQEIQNFHYDVGRQGIEIYPCIKFVFNGVFLCQLHAHIYAIKNVFAETVVFQETQGLHNFNNDVFVMSQSFISLPSFMFVSAVVSEIHDLNQSKLRIILKRLFSTYHLSQA